MRIEAITFLPRIRIEEHPRYPAFRDLIGIRDFAAYREVFERGWAETSITCGEGVCLIDLPITDELPPSTLLPNLMGINHHAPKRVRFAEEFIGAYERFGRKRFLKEIAPTTEYVKDIRSTEDRRLERFRGFRRAIARWRMERRIEYRITSFLNVYENMKKFGTLVGGSHVIHDHLPPLGPMDVPWAIDYYGYMKLREGAHRRAAGRYLGWEAIPTLVFEFERVTPDNLKKAHPYLRDNFDWFVEIVEMAANIQSLRRS
jgi:hypothetical protein